MISPLPKIVGVIAAIAATLAVVDPSLLAALGIGPAIAKGIISACVLIGLLSHSLTGSGGKTP